jgi:hypothetical protein
MLGYGGTESLVGAGCDEEVEVIRAELDGLPALDLAGKAAV